MSGSTFQPPILISPEQDNPQQTAFINQNFLSLASELEANSIRVVQSGNFTINAVTITASAGTYGAVNTTVGGVTHNLGYVPAWIAFMEQAPGVRTALPYTLNDTAGGNVTWQSYNPAATTTRFFINLRGLAYNNSYTTLVGSSITYYLIQLPAD